MRRRFKEIKPLLILTGFLAFLLLGCAWSLAEPEIRAGIGYDGVILSGRYVPLSVEIKAGETEFEGRLTVDIGMKHNNYDRLCLPVSLESGETRRIEIPVRPLIEQRSFTVKLMDGDTVCTQSVADTEQLVPEEALVIGVFGGQEQLAQALGRIEERSVHGELEEIHAIALDDAFLMSDSRCIEAFDALVMEEAATKKEAQAALEDWQRKGGVLISMPQAMDDADAAARQVFEEIQKQKTPNGLISREAYSYAFGEGLNTILRVNEGEGIAGAAVLLAGYVLIAGIGLYLLMKKLDRSKDLWLIIPASAAVMCAVLCTMGTRMTLNKPASASVHVTHVDEKGDVRVQELALLNTADQGRLTVTTQDGLALGRMEYTGFSGWVKMSEEEMELRDVITLGEKPSIEMIGQAAWKRRALTIEADAAPKGRIEASAWMEEDGLHVRVHNGTDQTIQNAVLLTEMGFAGIGELSPGGETLTLLKRTDDPLMDEEQQILLEEGVMAPYQESLHRVISYCVDPEMAYDEAFRRSKLDRREQDARNLLSSKLSLAGNVTSGEALDCVLIGEVPGVACQTLMLDGRPVERRAYTSVLIAEIPFETHSETGYFYLPQQTFARMEASIGTDGRPVLGSKALPAYTERQEETCFGFALEGVHRADVERIHVSMSNYAGWDEHIALEFFDHSDGIWKTLAHPDRVTLSSGAARSAISESGEIFFRYRGAESDFRLPEIAVEGRIRQEDLATQEGGSAL